jgi:hypothetical protein
MAIVVISPVNVAQFPDGGGHFWVYMQYVQGLRQLGCEVYWLERFDSSGDSHLDASTQAAFVKRMERYGLDGKLILYGSQGPTGARNAPYEYIGVSRLAAETVLRKADLLLNFNYRIDPGLLSCFRRTALVDIDPGLLQFWTSHGQLRMPPHDLYFTTGETVGRPGALFPDCSLPWIHIRPPVCLQLWPYVHDPRCEAFTTVSSWWGDEWITDGTDTYENNKRVSFLEFADLPGLTSQTLELAIFFGKGDAHDLRILGSRGWRVRHSRDVARTPEMYRSYIQRSRGEFSCAKPSCMKFQNAWISDRTLCYLASGKPAVVQNTGPSSFLPHGEGLFRFSTMEEALAAFSAINADYERHCRAARALAETYFDAKQVVGGILNTALRGPASARVPGGSLAAR